MCIFIFYRWDWVLFFRGKIFVIGRVFYCALKLFDITFLFEDKSLETRIDQDIQSIKYGINSPLLLAIILKYPHRPLHNSESLMIGVSDRV